MSYEQKKFCANCKLDEAQLAEQKKTLKTWYVFSYNNFKDFT